MKVLSPSSVTDLPLIIVTITCKRIIMTSLNMVPFSLITEVDADRPKHVSMSELTIGGNYEISAFTGGGYDGSV